MALEGIFLKYIIYLIIVALSVLVVLKYSKRAKKFLHMSQLEGYEAKEYFKWLKNNLDTAFNLKSAAKPVKKPLVMTERANRLFRCNFLINVILLAAFTSSIHLIFNSIPISTISFLAFSFIFYYLQPITVYLSTAIMNPYEAHINRGYYLQAQNKIMNRKDLTVIGITGSFGKTSTKFTVATILSEKYKVLNTPESYNTPMGLSKVINNELKDDVQVFVAEMGAKKIGEIRELAELAKPKIGIITSIGPVHIETFKNIDNIMKTKYELIEELPTDGIAIFNYDNEYVRKLADKTFKEKILYGIELKDKVDIYVDDIEISEKGSSFTLKHKDGRSIRCTTKLLGKHNIYNILAGVAAALAMGLNFEEIKEGIAKIEPVEHRLNLIDSPTGVIIIDDAFNSNPEGTKAALEVISQFKEGKKFIITPGMIELGEMEDRYNKEFGANIGKVCDYAILVGEKRTKPIYEGLKESNFKEDHIFVVNSLDEATKIIGNLAKPKDVVLFENDLPDTYTE